MKKASVICMLLVVVGFVLLVRALLTSHSEANQVRNLTHDVLNRWNAYEHGDDQEELLNAYTKSVALRDMKERQLDMLLARAHTSALFGTLLVLAGLAGLWVCTSREIRTLRRARQSGPETTPGTVPGAVSEAPDA